MSVSFCIHKGDTIAIVGCSDGIAPNSSEVSMLQETLERLGLKTVVYDGLYRTPSGLPQPPEIRAASLMSAFWNPDIAAVFDITGGDAANGVLPYLDFEKLADCRKPFFGYSDLSVLLNPLQERSGIPVYYFQPKFLSFSAPLFDAFEELLAGKNDTLFQFHCRFLRGRVLSGKIVGGNIRCTAKLFGTPWQPDFSGKILFLESMSGSLPRIESLLRQYKQVGAFSVCSGVLLGNFTELAKADLLEELYKLVLEITGEKLSIACTTELGHQIDARCLAFGQQHLYHA